MERLRAQFETNVFGLVRMCQLVLPKMRAAGRGRIVNVGSMGGKLTFPGGGAYHATKYAVEAISDALRWEVAGFGIQVVLIEPGLITTNFGEVAAGSIAEAAAAEPDRSDDPYAAFNAKVSAATAGVYEGPMARLGGGPETVARAIERALTSRRPKARYKVTASARLAIGQRRLLPDRAWDAMLQTQFQRPGAD
jgi:NAD(P)-dependent dehydrogenase (short-subunit alcohol dehydrogenase family)